MKIYILRPGCIRQLVNSIKKGRVMAKSATPKNKFTFGLWTVSNIGRDPFGSPTREPISPMQACDLLGEVGGVYGVNFHDNDLIPIDASPAKKKQICADFKKALANNGLCVPMATTNLFSDPVFKDGAFTSGDPKVRAYAIQKTMASMDLGAEFGAKIYVFWGGREGSETDAGKDPADGVKRFRDSIDFLCEYSKAQNYGYRFALEAKPNEPRGNIYFATTGNYLALISTLKNHEMVGVNPEVAHETMAGLNFVHHVAQALEAGKLFHIDLNDQEIGRFDQDFRFGAANIKQAFFLVKLLSDHGYNGPLHFDAHAYRCEDYNGVKDFAKGCIRTFEILQAKVAKFNKDKEIQSLVKQINIFDEAADGLIANYSPEAVKTLKTAKFDRKAIAARGLPYERLDQLTMEIIMGVR